jgi:hypothetical protein
MNNNLKFRVWDIIYGFYMVYDPNRFTYRFPINSENVISEYTENHNRNFNLNELIQYERFKVEQFTGKQYRDWKDLYVGDVIDFSRDLATHRGIIVYSEYHAGFGIRYVDVGHPAVASLADPFLSFSLVEGLGNINENPELISEELRNIINNENNCVFDSTKHLTQTES